MSQVFPETSLADGVVDSGCIGRCCAKDRLDKRSHEHGGVVVWSCVVYRKPDGGAIARQVILVSSLCC